MKGYGLKTRFFVFFLLFSFFLPFLLPHIFDFEKPENQRMTCFSKMWLVQNFHKIKVLALTLFIYLVSPVLLICILLLLVYRGIISISAKVSRKDLVGMISPSTSVYASDELYGIPNRNVVCFLMLKGRLSVESLQHVIDKKILSVKNSNGAYKYSHLRMYPSKFHKFLFWKLEEEFKVGNHVIMYDKARDNNRVWTETDVYEIQKNLIRKQWTRFSSPWEILVIPNYRTQSSGAREVKTVLCVRFHMCIENEVSWMKLLVQILCDGNDSNGNGGGIGDPSETDVAVSQPKCTASSFPPATFIATLPSSSATLPHKIHMSEIFGNSKTIPIQVPLRATQRKFGFICRRILQKMAIPFRVPFDFAEQIMEPLSSNEWQVAEASLLKRDHVVLLDRFSVQHVKEIKNMLGVTFSSVLMAALSSALRVTFMEAGLKVPTQMKVMLPLNCSGSGNASSGGKERCNDEADG